VEVPTVSLVGYTNAGKSTLFNLLTEAGIYAADQLFATLDPTLRRVELPGDASLVLADTVGFISQLPHELVAAFRSTLQETTEAALLLHVVDAASPQRAVCATEVNDVLRQIGADQKPQIEIFNKIDLMDQEPPRIERGEDGLPRRIWLSAKSGEGANLLLQALSEFFHQEQVQKLMKLKPQDGRLRARLFQLGNVRSEQITEQGGWEIQVELPRKSFERLMQTESDLEKCIIA
jgi:GTP-binding protein HflX